MANMFLTPTSVDFRNKLEEQALRRQQIQSQIDAQRAKAAQLRDPRYTQSQLPSAIQVAEYYRGLSPDEQRLFRESRGGAVGDALAKQGLQYDPSTGAVRPMQQFGAALGQIGAAQTQVEAPVEAQAAAMKTGAIEKAKISTQTKEEALANLGQVEASANEMLSVLNDIEQSEGLSAVVGLPNPFKGQIGGYSFPGSPAADFSTLYERLDGQKFKQAYETLKGGGQITEIESQKATQALATMSTAQSEKAFLKGLREYKAVIEGALKRARIKAGINPDRPQTPAPQQQSSTSGITFAGWE